MKKLLLVLPLVAGVSWAGSTYYAGTQTQPTYEKLVSQLNEFKPFRVVSKEYHPGFLSSTAITQVMDSARADASVLLTLQHVIDHSPIGMDSEGARIGASTIVTTVMTEGAEPEVLKMLAGFQGSEPFVLNTRVGFSGNTVNELIVSPYSKSTPDVEISFKGGALSLDSSQSGEITVTGGLGEIMAASSDTTDINISASTIVANLNRIGTGMYTGNYSIDLPLLSMENSDAGFKAIFSDSSLISQTDVSGDIVTSDAVFSIAAIDAPAPVTSAAYKVKVDGMSLSALVRSQRLLENLPLYNDEVMATPESMAVLLEAYKAMITPGIKFEIGLEVGNTGGAMKSSVNSTFKGDQTPTGYDSIATARDLLMAMDIRLNLDADADAIQLTPAAMLLMHPMSADYIIDEGGKYTSDIHIHDLLMDVNGDPRSLEAMLGPMLETPLEIPSY